MGDPIFLRLTDGDQNNDPAAAETVLVTLRDPGTGDVEVVRLTETGPNTGVFTGYIETDDQAAAIGNGVLNVAVETSIVANYIDSADATDTEVTAVLVDPYGMVFNSSTGAPVDGAIVSLLDVNTGNPATVFGDDGVSAYPASVTTGGTVQDSSGRTYTMTPGGYRFPFIRPGQYSFQIVPPAGYRAPSQVSDAALQQLPGAPFALVTPGSRGENFTVNPGPAIHIDIPIDPTGNRLYLIKTAGKQTAAIGDFVPYQLIVENIDPSGPVPAVTITDLLPPGFRYRKGSARLNSARLADPAVSADGRSLTFAIGDLAASAKAEVRYVAEVGAGARPGRAVNSAVAQGDGGVTSNTATATVVVTEDLVRGKSFIVGRVFDRCGDAGGGVAGVRIYLEDGTYTLTDRDGKYHFEALRPGAHVVQLDTETVPSQYEVQTCEENTRFAGNAFSQFVDLQGGTLWRADFHLGLKPRMVGEAGIELRSSLTQTVPFTPENIGTQKDTLINYAVPIHIGSVPVRNPRLTILLPGGVTYLAGSARLDAAAHNDPEISGGALTFRLTDLPGDWEGTLRFDGLVPLTGASGDLVTKAILTVDTPQAANSRTPVVDNLLVRESKEERRAVPDIVIHPRFATLSAELTSRDKKEIDRVVKNLEKLYLDHITVTGHTDSQQIRGRGRKKFSDNYVLSQARAQAVADYLAPKLKLTPEQVTIIGKGPDEPVADNKTAKGRARNRRVELQVATQTLLLWSDIRNLKGSSGMTAVATEGLRPGEEWGGAAEQNGTGNGSGKTMPEYDTAWANRAQPGLEWLWPGEGHSPPIPTIKLAVKHDPNRTLTVLLNGQELDAIYLDGTVRNQIGTVAVSMWRGVHILEGDNILDAVERDESGAETGRVTRVVHCSRSPVNAVLVPKKSRLEADGKRPPVIAVRLTDKDGHPAREGMLGEYSVDPPHLPRRRVEDLQQSPLIESASRRLKYEVGDDGVALIELQPTMQSGEAVVRFPFMTGEQEVRAWLKPEERDWILVGLAEGTYGYNVATGNMVSLGAAGADEHFYDEGRVAFYAKGKIKGEWLLTMAYDSAKATTDGRPSMYQTIDPNKYYLLYGDATEQRYDAASAKKIYVKVERDQFYALFGDFSTGLTVTELSKYSRNLTGVKSEMKGENFEYSVFLSETTQAFVKDEIRGDGTSGLYRLSRKNIVLNSDAVTIEVRDRFKSEVVLSRQPLARYLDYTIDYDSGTIWFKTPVYSRDENFNPIYIVVEYEAFDAADKAYTYGGRGAVKLMDNKVVVGATHVHEGRTGGEGDLNGVDATVQVTPTTRIKAEAATTRTDQPGGGTADGSAYLAEVQHRSEKIEGKAYVRGQGNGFGLGQQNGSETGTRKTGGDIIYRINTPWSAGAEVFRQETLSTGATRDMAEVRGRYVLPRYEARLGVRHAEDRLGTGEAYTSDQVFASSRYQFTDRLAGRVQHDQSIGSGDSADFPTRTTLGLDYRLNNSATLFADQEFTHSAAQDTATSRIGVKASPWTGGQLSSTMEQQTTESGVRLFSTTGLKQGWQINKQWSVDGGLDRSATIRNTAAPTVNTNVPPASGDSEDFTAVNLGAGYRQPKWSWTGRVEQRMAESEDKFSTFNGANGEVSEGLALAAGLQTFRTLAVTGLTRFNGDLRIGAAYRPLQTRFIILDRFDLIEARQQGSDFNYDNWRVVNNFVMNMKHETRTQASLLYGSKYVKEKIDENDYRGYTDLLGLEGRYDITKQWDIGLRGLRLHSWAIGQTSYGAGASVGFNAAKNLWVSLGYNITGFTDRDFSNADFTTQGPFIKLRMKFDQVSVREAVRWITGQ
ncbi:MAG: OmpA family protein [Nitrospirota bacterium]|nr:OmpA family protein [Nitrospirota bacterium]